MDLQNNNGFPNSNSRVTKENKAMAQGIWEMSILYPKTSKDFHHDIKFWKGIRKRCTIKKLFLKILQYSEENTFVGVLFKKNAGLQSCNFIKKKPQHRCFL